MMKQAATQSVEQARKAFEEALASAQKTVATLEGSSSQLQGHMRDLTKESVDFATASAEAAFAFVESLTKVKSPEDAIALQKSFVEAQMERLGKQTRSFSDSAIKAAQGLTKPFER